MESKTPIKVSERVLEGFSRCRETGEFNMLTQYQLVKMWCMENDYYESAHFIRSHFGDYIKGVLHGFEVEG